MTTPKRCRSRSSCGGCGRASKHNGPHAVPIGDGVWFGYLRGGKPLGYGHLDGDTFTPIPLHGWGTAKPGAATEAAPGCKRDPSVAGSSFAFALAARGLAEHPWQEYNAHGNTCHYPGCRLAEDEHS